MTEGCWWGVDYRCTRSLSPGSSQRLLEESAAICTDGRSRCSSAG